MNSNSSLLASPRAAGAATVTRTSSAFTPDNKHKQAYLIESLNYAGHVQIQIIQHCGPRLNNIPE